LYRRGDLAQIHLECRDFDVVEEILFRLKALHGEAFKVVEVPDHFRERKHGETKRRLGPFVVSYLGTLVRLRWQTRRRAS
jgi:dolichol-phosphate mannosyltransferase